MEGYSEYIRLKGMSSEHGLVPVLPRYRNHVRRARRPKRFLHALGDARIIAEQNACQERGLRFGQNLRDNVFRTRLEGIQPPQGAKP